MAQSVAEKRAELEKKLAKIDNPDAEALAKRKAKLQEEINKLASHKEFEGKGADLDVYGDGSFLVPVTVSGYVRKVYGKELYKVEPVMGKGSVTVPLSKLLFDGAVPTPEAPSPEASGEGEANPGNPGEQVTEQPQTAGRRKHR